ncbi:MAG: VOC family protein [Paracoccaceae bacterium]
MARLEHVNITVTTPAPPPSGSARSSAGRCRKGGSIHGGTGLACRRGGRLRGALCAAETDRGGGGNYFAWGLNHVGVVVDDLDAAEARETEAGFVPHSHADYEPGRRFYFHDGDGIEWEVVSYG